MLAISNLIFFQSCIQKTGPNYYLISFRNRDYLKSDTTILLSFEKIAKGDTSKVTYTTKYGYWTYLIIGNNDSGFIVSNIRDKLLHPNDSVIFMRRLSDTVITTNTDKFSVTKYILDESVQDGSTFHYYCPQFGVFVVHGDQWPGIKLLQTSDTSINSKINYLVLSVVPHRYNGMKLRSK